MRFKSDRQRKAVMAKLNPYYVGYTTVPQLKLDRTPTKKWRVTWFKSENVKAKSANDAVRKIVPDEKIYNVKAMLLDKMPKDRLEKVKVLFIGEEIKVREPVKSKSVKMKYFSSTDLAAIRKRTNYNDHSRNYYEIAKKINSPLTKKLKEILDIRDREGGLSGDVYMKQSKYIEKMEKEMKAKLSPAEYEAVNSRL